MADYEPSEEIRELPVVKKLHEETLNYVGGDSEDGESGELLGATTAKFQPENEIRGLPEGKLQDTAVMDLILQVQHSLYAECYRKGTEGLHGMGGRMLQSVEAGRCQYLL